ncbi:hypothetical protein OHV05_34100 [Kitasatospora sp. NBC_00070]|uniref:hypothetical protein n=1 Tax=Kitasatospora sp. NBC_00070 TaxID=2975962 RepID=UPI003250FFD5
MRARKAITALGIAALTSFGAIAAAPAAQAGGYGCSGSHVWSGDVAGAGTVHTYYNGSTNCSVFVKSLYSGTRTYTDIYVQKAGDPGWIDGGGGYFTTYAGPVTIYAPGSCIREWVIELDPNGNTIVNQPTPWHSCS